MDARHHCGWRRLTSVAFLLGPAAALAMLSGAARAQLTEDPTLPAARSGSGTPALTGYVGNDPGIEAILNFEFDLADSIYTARKKADPISPEGEFGLGLCAWWKLVSGREGVDPESVKEYFERAARISRQYSSETGHRTDALYYSGRAHSLLASLHLIQGNLMPAYHSGQRAKSYLEACLKLDPGHHDAALGLGLYHYYVDALPQFFKVIGWFLGMRGDRERGLAELRRASEHGERTRIEASYFLSNVLTNFEGDPSAGLGLIRWLQQRYPKNHVFFLEYQNVLESLGYYPEAEAAMRAALEPGGRFAGIRAVRLMLGRNLYRQGRYAEGAETLEAELQRPFDRNDPAIPWFYYFAGRCRELMGDRAAAEKLYATAEKSKTGGNVAKLAEDRRNTPEPEGEQRLRRARGLTRQRGRAMDAAREWEGILADVESGKVTLKVGADQIRFRAALCLEEAERYAEAASVYRAVVDPSLRDRAVMGAVRCEWRSGKTGRTVALLDSLSESSSGDRGRTRSLLRILNGEACTGPDGDAPAPNHLLVYREPEAFLVEVMLVEGDRETRCAPMTLTGGVWQARLAIAPSERYYYFRVDGSRREPDPLAQWAQSDGGTVLSVVGAPAKLAERTPWSGQLLH